MENLHQSTEDWYSGPLLKAGQIEGSPVGVCQRHGVQLSLAVCSVSSADVGGGGFDGGLTRGRGWHPGLGAGGDLARRICTHETRTIAVGPRAVNARGTGALPVAGGSAVAPACGRIQAEACRAQGGHRRRQRGRAAGRRAPRGAATGGPACSLSAHHGDAYSSAPSRPKGRCPSPSRCKTMRDVEVQQIVDSAGICG